MSEVTQPQDPKLSLYVTSPLAGARAWDGGKVTTKEEIRGVFILHFECYHHHMTKYFVKTHKIVNQKDHHTISSHLYDVFQQAKVIFGKKNQNSHCPWRGNRDWLGRGLRELLEVSHCMCLTRH